MNILVVIPARGGSKGIPGKNIKLLNGKPLIYYTIDVARTIVSDENICVTTDDDEIIKVVESYGLKVPFKRPEYLATDTCGSYEVILHALNYYEKLGYVYDAIVLLQPTSPFRTPLQVKEAIKLYRTDIDMVVSVKKASSNPYYDCFEEDQNGNLIISKGDDSYKRRQDCPLVYEYNGAIYVLNPLSLKRMDFAKFKKKIKYLMDSVHSIDIDNQLDWMLAECIIKNRMIEL